MRLPLWGSSVPVQVGSVCFYIPAHHKFTGKELRALAALSPQARSRKLRVLAGLCAQCGKEPLDPRSKNLGPKCLLKLRKAKRKSTGAKTKYKE